MFGLMLAMLLVPNFSLAVFEGSCPEGTIATDTGCAPIPGGLAGILYKIHNLLNLIVPALVALGVVYFVWGVVRYVIADGEEAKKKGRDAMIFGIIGLAAIVSLWGLVTILQTTFGLANVPAPSLEPLEIPTSQGTCAIGEGSKLQDYLCYFTKIINDSLIPLLFALGVVYFVWGVVRYVIADGEEARKKGKDIMIYGIIGLAVMLSVWGLAGILAQTFGVNSSVLPQVKP